MPAQTTDMTMAERELRTRRRTLGTALTCLTLMTPMGVGAVTTQARAGSPGLPPNAQFEASATVPDKERIVFESARDGGFWPRELYTMKTDGTDVQLLVNIDPDFQHKDPVWSPDGIYVAYWVYVEELGNVGIRRIAATGGGESLLVPRRLPDDAEPWTLNWPEHPAWSPDGAQLAFDASPFNDEDWIWVLDLETGSLIQLVEGREPTWSPDGAMLAYTHAQSSSSTFAIWTVNADGSEAAPLTAPVAAFDSHPDWSPDGSRIVFHRRGLDPHIYVINADGSNEQQLTADGFNEDPVWSPDGSQIAFHRQVPAGSFQIHIMDADGSNLTQVTSDPRGAQSPDWRTVPPPVTDVEMVVLGGPQAFEWWTGSAIPGAVSGGVVAELDLMTTGTVTRLWGSDRYATAVEISKAHFSPGVSVAYVATGLDYPDALSAGAVAGLEAGPVLLIAPDSIPSAVAGELSRLVPDRIVIVGGSSVVSSTVEAMLSSYTSGPVTRLSGPDRYGTAAAISQASFSPGVDVAYVATGENFPDALPAATAAGQLGGPLLLVRQNAIPSATAAELARLQPGRIVIAGESDVVSDGVASALAAYTSGPVERHAGSDRFGTAAAISQGVAPVGSDTVYIATGANFPDGVAASPAAIGASAPLLLVWTDFLPSSTRAEIVRLSGP